MLVATDLVILMISGIKSYCCLVLSTSLFKKSYN